MTLELTILLSVIILVVAIPLIVITDYKVGLNKTEILIHIVIVLSLVIIASYLISKIEV